MLKFLKTVVAAEDVTAVDVVTDVAEEDVMIIVVAEDVTTEKELLEIEVKDAAVMATQNQDVQIQDLGAEIFQDLDVLEDKTTGIC